MAKSLTTNTMSRPRFIALLFALITLAVFLPAGSCQFINYDDPDYVTENPMVQAGWTLAGLEWAFTTGQANNWHPLTWLSHMTDCGLFGLNPGAHHLVNVLFHAVNAALMFLLWYRLSNKTRAAVFIAALFAWHPLHVESVAWISERKDVLSTFFALLSLSFYVKYATAETSAGTADATRQASHFYRLSLLFYALGLMAKPMLVTLPCVMLLLDYWPLKRLAATGTSILTFQLREKWPFFLLTILSCVITYLAQARSIHGHGAVVSLAHDPLDIRLGNLALAYSGYLGHFLWPAKLAVFYPLPQILLIPVVAGNALLLLGISTLAWRWRKVRPYFTMGWLWFLGMLVPVIGLVRVGGASMADRYTYLPLVGIFIIIAFAANEVINRFPASRLVFRAAAVAALIGCIVMTEKQLSYWKDSESLFYHDLKVVEDNDVARIQYGRALEQRDDLSGAAAQYQAALQLYSRRAITHSNLANVLARLGRHADSLAEYGEALRLQPDDAVLHLRAADELFILGNFTAALRQYAGAQKCDPSSITAHVGAAKVLFKLGHDAEGVKEFRAALRLEPDNYQTLATVAHYLAANENDAARDGNNALPLATRANEVSGGVQPVVLDILGMAFAENGDFTNAAACSQKAIDLATAAQLNGTDQMRARLLLYQKKQPWRESFKAAAPGTN
ncbi:MAG: hypothetical protein JF609_03200 [Verrucomicrobia bacterium]|nr:hypothetical protein [Verrucomicrobiota bacterium]